MLCPKCGHVQNGSFQCDQCGIIFSKYRSPSIRQQHPITDDSDDYFMLITKKHFFIALLGLVVVIFFLSGDKEPEHSNEISQNNEVEDKSTDNDIDTSDKEYQKAYRQNGRSQKNNLDEAIKATVTIESELGLGTGFFINSQCYILTNKHVVVFNKNKFKDTLKKIKSARSELAELANIIEEKHNHFDAKCNDCSLEARHQYIEDETLKYDQLQHKINIDKRKISQLKYDLTIKIMLSDKTSYTAQLIKVSDSYDLALLKINQSNCSFLTPYDENSLHFGDQIFAIGNPSGFSHTITSGLFSRIEGSGDTKMIQTDAAINPGNSGGPIVTEKGLVLGVVTLKAKKLEGISFAIPISVAFDEFNDYLY